MLWEVQHTKKPNLPFFGIRYSILFYSILSYFLSIYLYIHIWFFYIYDDVFTQITILSHQFQSKTTLLKLTSAYFAETWFHWSGFRFHQNPSFWNILWPILLSGPNLISTYALPFLNQPPITTTPLHIHLHTHPCVSTILKGRKHLSLFFESDTVRGLAQMFFKY